MSRKHKTSAGEAKAVEKFNAANPVGTPVIYWSGLRGTEEEGVSSVTRTQAQLLSGHTAVVWVEGRGDCHALSHIKVIK